MTSKTAKKMLFLQAKVNIQFRKNLHWIASLVVIWDLVCWAMGVLFRNQKSHAMNFNLRFWQPRPENTALPYSSLSIGVALNISLPICSWNYWQCIQLLCWKWRGRCQTVTFFWTPSTCSFSSVRIPAWKLGLKCGEAAGKFVSQSWTSRLHVSSKVISNARIRYET